MKQHLEKCLLCPRPFCTTCPAGTPVRDAIKLVREGKTEEAGALLFENNPLSAITGAVCPNHLYCHGSCILGKKNNAVDFGKIERVISALYLDTLLAKKTILPEPGFYAKRILIAGSGPAGLSLACYLRRLGHDVTVYERNEKPGGMLRYGIPDFRLDKTLIDKLAVVLKKMHVRFETNKTADLNNLTPLLTEFDAVYLAIGACNSRRLGIEGEELPHVIPAVRFLKEAHETPENYAGFKQAVILGGGNVAIDCALAAKNMMSEGTVTLCYRRSMEEMKCYPKELQLARDQNIKFEFHMVPKRIEKSRITFEQNGSEHTRPADLIITAIGQLAADPQEEICIETDRGFIKSENYKTNIPNVFVLGDAATGTQTIIKAVAAAKELSQIEAQ